MRLIPQGEPRIWEVGARIGPDLERERALEACVMRRMTSDGTQALRRAHLRRGHWHRHWIKDEEQEWRLVPRWHRPVWVSKHLLKDYDSAPATIRRVRQPEGIEESEAS